MSDPFLVVEDLTVKFPTEDGLVNAVTDLSYTVEQGKTLGIVGESGSGKSVSSMAVLGLHDMRTARITGSIKVGGQEVVGLGESKLRKLRGKEVAMIFQDALAALHPFYKVGSQLAEAYLVHHPKASKREARRKAIEMLDRVGIPQPDRRVDDFPHQFSGGMRQRAMIAMGLINDPKLLIADEPTTALDVTVQAQILDLLQDLQREFNSAVIIITHDLGVIAEMADDILVMYGGRGVEKGPAKEVPPTGCAFHPRCAHVDKVPGNKCVTELPPLTAGPTGAGHLNRCHLADPVGVFENEVLPVIAPELLEES